MVAGLTMWDSNGNIIYENPRACKFIAKYHVYDFSGTISDVPMLAGNDRFVLAYGEAQPKRAGAGRTKGSIANFNTMYKLEKGILNWNIPRDIRIGNWYPPYTDIEFYFFVLAR